jgi:hypothetical protein
MFTSFGDERDDDDDDDDVDGARDTDVDAAGDGATTFGECKFVGPV